MDVTDNQRKSFSQKVPIPLDSFEGIVRIFTSEQVEKRAIDKFDVVISLDSARILSTKETLHLD